MIIHPDGKTVSMELHGVMCDGVILVAGDSIDDLRLKTLAQMEKESPELFNEPIDGMPLSEEMLKVVRMIGRAVII